MTIINKKNLCIRVGEMLGFATQKEYGVLISIGRIFFYFVWRHRTKEWYENEEKYENE